MYEELVIPVYLINLPERKDRLKHSMTQFKDKSEFYITIIEACKHERGNYGLWMSIVKAVKMAKDNDDDVMILCEDDHKFTSDYTKEILFRNIIESNEEGAKILLGGVSNFNQAIPLSTNRCWVDFFQYTQFTIIFKSFFDEILSEPFGAEDAADLKFSHMTSHKMIFYPFISVHKDFGYSDIPVPGLDTARYSLLFENSMKKLDKIYQIKEKLKACTIQGDE
ncbi:hypothetical protein HMPREF0765_2085 [Sphingobacterium spiritivorum ATCC 33300]|uniref:LPS glycosyltransferase n=1 Tax=Sphingobacterium spiritivorum ATCC 33300 TaxID=525372 RepID=C2FXM9_SPHSI|nr:hypothetical protein [Sphingobacterium spiritivorum]EEI92470.1 hypothetical protein HMPREF0765_2085 [Sphingobacterium spiritivorum ATCC 33300]QQS96790.1 glycosyl transferase [Sphingobacterium spiritivorum]